MICQRDLIPFIDEKGKALGSQVQVPLSLDLFLGRPQFNSAQLHQLGFLTMFCLFALFVSSFAFFGPGKSHWGVVN